jgi:hypothetical protein
MAKHNYFAIAAAMGATLGPRITVPHGQLASPQLASTISNLQHRRRHLWDDEITVRNASEDYYGRVKAAFKSVRGDCSVEKVIVDASLNRKFIIACERDFALEDSPFRLNLALLTLRKRGQLRGLGSDRKSRVHDQWQYAYGSEIAAQSIFYRHGVTVDTMLCHPVLAKKFDEIAGRLAPGFSSFDYRWTALNIRKKGTGIKGLRASDILDWSPPVPFSAADDIPDDEGIYSLQEDDHCLFVGTAEDLQANVTSGQHIIEPDIFGDDLWKPIPERLSWQYADMSNFESEERYAVVRELVGTLRPVFNVPRGRRVA